MLYHMEIGADIHKVICFVFLASRCTHHQDVLNIKLVVSSCPASTWSHQDVQLRQFAKCILLYDYSHITTTPSYASTNKNFKQLI